MNYFDLYPNVELPSFSDKRNSSNDTIVLKNLFKRGKIRDDIYGNVTAFSKYYIEGDDRPDNVAHKIYENERLDWVVLISNNIINVQNEWPMGQRDFRKYLDNKYDPIQLSQIHHYETNEIRDIEGNILLQKGLVVDSDFTYSYSTDGIRSDVNSVISISYLDYEIKKNVKCVFCHNSSPHMLDLFMKGTCSWVSNVFSSWQSGQISSVYIVNL